MALWEGPALETDDPRSYITYSGLAEFIQQAMPGTEVESHQEYPAFEGIPWAHPPEHEQRQYQEEAKEALWAARHGAVSLPTGSGKSRIIAEMAHDAGLQTLVMAPTRSIAGQLYRDFVNLFGKRYVGMFGNGKKEVGKKFTIAIAASLTRIDDGTPAWAFFSRTQVFFADESHMCPADTLEKVCSGLVKAAPYRFFFSATQTRTDGSEMVLKGITSQVVYTKSFEELVREKYLARPHWRMCRVASCDPFHSDDPLRMTQRHLLYSPGVLKQASVVINGQVARGHRVLVLIEEIGQFAKLLPYLKVGPVKFAHGAAYSDKKMRDTLPEEYWRSDPSELVDSFDRGDFPVLVGTSCISMGTDVKSPETLVYLQGGVSAIQVPQAVGRGTRRFKFADGRMKENFLFVDFVPILQNGNVDDTDPKGGRMSLPYRHALARSRLYEKLYPNALRWL